MRRLVTVFKKNFRRILQLPSNIDSAVKTRYSGTLPNQIGGRRRHAVRAPISPFIDQKRDHAA